MEQRLPDSAAVSLATILTIVSGIATFSLLLLLLLLLLVVVVVVVVAVVVFIYCEVYITEDDHLEHDFKLSYI